MIKKTITFTGFDGEETTHDAYFNLTTTEALDITGLEFFQGNEVKAVDETTFKQGLSQIKEFLKIAYGVRTGEGGKRFSKHPDHWAEFEETGALDAFLLDFLSWSEGEIMKFLTGIFPEGLFKKINTPEGREALSKLPVDVQEATTRFIESSSDTPQIKPPRFDPETGERLS